MIVLGIDPGSRRCGYGVVAREAGRLRVLGSGVLVPDGACVAERLGRILDGLADVIARARPSEVSIEHVFAGISPRSALVLGEARGVALAVAARAGLPVFEYQPSEVKLAFTGHGRASKEQMLRTARTLLGIEAALSDEADALAVAVCHLARRTSRLVQAGGAAFHARSRANELSPSAPGAASRLHVRRGAADALSRLRPARRTYGSVA